MDQRRTVIRLVLGGAAFGLGFVLGTPTEPTPTIPANQYGMLSKTTMVELSAASSTERSTWRADLIEEEAELREQIDALLGPPEPWPDDPPEALTPEAFADWPLQAVEDILQTPPAWVDCDNYPCMANFALPNPADEEVFLSTIKIRNQLYGELGKDRVMWSTESGMHIDEDGNDWLLISISLLPEDPPESIRQQVLVRSVLNRIAMRSQNALSPSQE